MFIMFSIMFVFGGVIIVFYSGHFFLVLLGLEICLLSVFGLLSSFLLPCSCYYVSFLYLLVMVCMGAFGICLFVEGVRGSGLNFFMSSNFK